MWVKYFVCFIVDLAATIIPTTQTTCNAHNTVRLYIKLKKIETKNNM